MAKFRYRMQNILDVKMKLESQAKIAYGIANQKYLEEQKKLQEIILRRASYEKILKESSSGFSCESRCKYDENAHASSDD